MKRFNGMDKSISKGIKYISIVLILLIGIGGSWGCGTPYMELRFNSSYRLNPDDSGHPLPVVIRIYQLVEKDGIEKSDLNTLWEKDRDIFRDDILMQQEYTMFPSSSMFIKIDKDDKTKYLGIAAFFRKPVGKSWLQVIKLSKSRRQKIQINLSDHNITAAVLK